jgi:DDE superfamily endonuclease
MKRSNPLLLSLVTTLVNESVKKHFFLNMDQTAINFELKFNQMITHKGSTTVSCRDSGSNQRCCTVCITLASDGTILPPFFIFKGRPNAIVEQEIRAAGILGCAQPNAWFDEEVGQKWVDQILVPYVASNPDGTFLLIDRFHCHQQQCFVNRLSANGFVVDYIPAGYTCVLQPVDVGFNAPFK